MNSLAYGRCMVKVVYCNLVAENKLLFQVKLSRMRQRIAERLKEAQNVNAMLTTFNEIDMRLVGDEMEVCVYCCCVQL